MRNVSWIRGVFKAAVLAALAVVFLAGWMIGTSPDIVISQVYGGGGNSGAFYKNDFIELFNRGTNPVNIGGWSVQYASSSGSTWQVTNISGTIPAGGYYLVQEAQGTGGTADLPTPDATGTIAMSGTNGKVILVRVTTAQSGSCPSGSNIVDVVGYGSANCYEGAGATGVLSNTTAAIRNESGCAETDNNNTDFSVAAPTPRNSASPIHLCAGVTLSIDDVNGFEGDSGTSTLSFTVSLSGPAPTGGVTFDIATADGTATVADNDYVANSVTGATIAEGDQTYTFDVTVNGDTTPESDETFFVDVTNIVGATATDAQGQGTILDDDTIRLSINDVAVLEGDSGTTPAHFVVTLSRAAYSGGVTFDIATADGTATTADNDYQAVSLTGVTIPEGETEYSLDVLVNGDTTQESDETFTVNVTNVTGTAVQVTDGTGTGTITNDDYAYTAIHDIQGSGSTSPLVGQTVTTRGIVTARKYNGYFIQSREELYDSDPDTSEGLQVYTGSTPPVQIVVGADVVISGTVSEYIPTADPYSPPLTELTGSSVVVVLATGQTVPAPVILTTADTSPAGSIEQLEKYEGMLVEVPSLITIAPTQGTITEASATASSNGTFYGVIDGIDRPFREAGIEAPDPIPTPPCCIPRFDGNPERLRVDTDALDGTTAADVTTGVEITNLVGPLDYGYRTYTILAENGWGSDGNIDPIPVITPSEEEVTVATFNMERFFDTVDDPSTSDPVLTPTAYNNRLNKASLIIRNILRLPDILGVEEMENLTTLQAVAAKVNADVVAAGGSDPQYVAYLEEGNDVGGIDVGFLVKSTRVTVHSVVQYGKNTIFPWDGSLLNDRPPLVLDATVNLEEDDTFPIVVIVNHLRSMSGIDDAADGPRVRAKRQAQAEYLADLIQTFQVADPDMFLVSLGDYNAFDVNDGYGDVVGTVMGSPVPADEVLVQVSTDLVDPNLINLYSTVTADQAYSYSFDGNAQALDHILVNQNLRSQLDSLQVARVDADFPQSYYGDPNRPERLSDHDPVVAYFSWNPPARGDLNLDGSVDAADLLLFANYFAGNDAILDGNADLNFDGLVDLADLVWLQNEVGGNNPAR